MEGRRALSYQVRHIFANIHHPFPLTASPPKGLKGFIPVGPRPTECVLPPQGNANNELLANFAEKSRPKPWKVVQGPKWKSGL